MADEQQKPNNGESVADNGGKDPKTGRFLKKNKYAIQPGETRNPYGAPRRKPITDELLRLLPKKYRGTPYTTAIVRALLRRAAEGDMPAIKEVREVIEGKIAQPISGPEGGPIPVSMEGIDEALVKLLAELQQRKL